jgi:hypothetical protein
MAQHGYAAGDPFGDPSQFTRGTQASEVDRFNQWMRSQPWWQSIKGSASGFGDQQKAQLEQALRANGIAVPHGVHIDDAGNFNQSRTKGDWAKLAGEGAAVGGLALTGLGAAGIGPMSGLFGGTAALDAGASAIPALEGGGTIAANLGAASALPAFSAASIPALGGGASLAADLGGAGALGSGASAGSAAMNYIPPGAAAAGDSIANNVKRTLTGGSGFSAADLMKLLAGGGLAAYGASQNHSASVPPELEQILALQKQRMDSQTPLYNSILKLSQSRLPTSVQS